MKKVNISHLNMNNNVNIYIDIYVFEIYIFHTNMHVNKYQQLKALYERKKSHVYLPIYFHLS